MAVDLAELKNLQTIVLDLEELKKLQSIAKRPRVRSLLSLEISTLQAKIFSNSTISDAEPSEEDTGKFGSKWLETEINALMIPNRPAVRKCAQRMCKRVIKRRAVQKMQKKLSEKIGTDQLSSSNLSVPGQLTEKVEEETVPSDNGILVIESGETIDVRNNQVMGKGSSFQTRVSEMGLKRKHEEIEEPEISMVKKKPKLTNIQQLPVINGGSCRSMEGEPNQQHLQTKTSEHVLQEKANPSDVNEASPMAVVATESADVSNVTSQTIPRRYVLIETDQQQKIQMTTHKEVKPSSVAAVAASGSRQRKSWCHRCRVPTHDMSECDHHNRTCFRCHENGHFAANCPNAPQNTIHPSGTRTAPAGGNTVVHSLLNEEPREETDSMPMKNGVDLMQASGSRQQRSWCGRCRVPTHAESECDRRNQTCFICHGKGHFAASCPNAPQNTIHPSGLRTATAGDNTVVHALLDVKPQEEIDLTTPKTELT